MNGPRQRNGHNGQPIGKLPSLYNRGSPIRPPFPQNGAQPNISAASNVAFRSITLALDIII